MNRGPFRLVLLLIPFALACFALSPTARAVDPPPDGGYPNQNTAEGEDALFSLTTGANNTAVGYHALHQITDSSENTAVGYNALGVSTAGPNTAIGFAALQSNTTGFNNTAVTGLYLNTTGHDNTSVGFAVLQDNTTGSFNTAMGTGALGGNGNNNCAIGGDAMQFGGGDDNVAIGVDALILNTSNRNVAVGFNAMLNVGGTGNIGIGAEVGNNLHERLYKDLIYIGTAGVDRERSTIRIGDSGVQTAAFIAGINGVTVPDGVDVVINSSGQLGTISSSARYKEAIRPMANGSEVVLGLRPVSFSYQKELDPATVPQFGLIAEEVAKVDPDLVVRDSSGRPYSVRYQAVNAMLLNEFLKEHRKNEEQQATITELKSTMAQQQKDFRATAAHQQKQIEALTAGLQKVSAQVELSKAAPQTVLNRQ